MRVFISWSGTRARQAAEALRTWLQDVIPALRPWISSEDINPGLRWSDEIATALQESKVGIIVVTNENREKPWIMFEAGAISKAIGDPNLVIPYLLDFGPSLVKEPLGLFNAVERDEAGTRKLVRALNGALGDERLAPDRLDRQFNRCWGELSESLDKIPTTDEPAPAFDMEEAMKQLLGMMKGLERRETTRPVPSEVVLAANLNRISSLSKAYADRLESLQSRKSEAVFTTTDSPPANECSG